MIVVPLDILFGKHILQCFGFIKAPFEIAPREPVSGIPGEVLKRCFGKQAPCTPRAQRLLVAATKEAKVEQKQNKGKGKGKGKGGGDSKKQPKTAKKTCDTAGASDVKGIGEHGTGTDDAVTPAPKSSEPETTKRKRTPYAEAKLLFMERPLDYMLL